MMTNDQNSAQAPQPKAHAKTSVKARKFFWLRPYFPGGGKGHGVRLANEEALITQGLVVFAPPPAKGYGFAELPEKPQLIYDRKKGKMPADLNLFGFYWLVSARLKELFEAVDPAAFEFVDCDFMLPDGSAGPHYYLADIVRVLDALDEEASSLRIKYERDHRTGKDVKIYSLAGKQLLVFREEIVGDAHIFRTPYTSIEFCDDTLKAAFRAVGITGSRFVDMSEK